MALINKSKYGVVFKSLGNSVSSIVVNWKVCSNEKAFWNRLPTNSLTNMFNVMEHDLGEISVFFKIYTLHKIHIQI